MTGPDVESSGDSPNPMILLVWPPVLAHNRL